MKPSPMHVLTEKEKKDIAGLDRHRHRERLDAFVVEGARSVDAALNARAEVLYLVSVSPSHSEERSNAARSLGGKVSELPERDFARLSHVETSQGVLLVARRQLLSEDAMLECDRVLVLDGIQDPGNVGTLLRTAAWFGVDGVVAGEDTADFYNPKVVRASMGGLWDVKLSTTVDLSGWLEKWRQHGGRTWAADLHGTPIDAWMPSTPSVLIIGSEAHGISRGVLDRVDGNIHIPGHGSPGVTESLNAAVAGGLMISHWMKGLTG